MSLRLVSGMRPTGRLHLGHLVGALDNWLKLQERYECFFLVADWHALTTGYTDTSELQRNTIEMAHSWRALGIDFSRSTVFVQSDVKEHAELHLLFSMVTPMAWLERDPTLKTMLEDLHLKAVSYGLMGYPVLQAADILLYKAGVVPVGIDQVPHIELAREIVRAFNRHFGQVFPEPEALLTLAPRLLGPDGKKMSKSLGNCIYLDDPPDAIAKQVMQLVTDPAKIHPTDPGDPDICSVQDYHKIFHPADAQEHDRACREGRLGCVKHKKYVAQVLTDFLKPYQAEREALKGREGETIKMLKDGAERAREIAAGAMAEAKRAVRMGV